MAVGGINEATARVRAGRHLSREETRELFELIMTGAVEVQPLADFLRALAEKGETIEEMTGAADVMNEKVTRVRCEADCIDTCGTGGDGINTFNVSTASAIIAAAAGACVAKHGSFSNTRPSGASDVISELGVKINPPIPVLERCFRKCGMAFLHAPYLHPAMKHAAPARRLLPIRTIFNLLGPLTNPAGAKRQLLGVCRPELTETLGKVLAARGATLAWVVYGDGLCDVSTTGPSRVTEVRGEYLRTFTVTPEEAGLPRANLSELLIDSPQASAAVIRAIFDGRRGACRDHTLLNAAAALIVAGIAEDLRDGVKRATEAVDSGAAREKLAKLARCAAEQG